ncbi:MAG TPA: hypothetical protein VL096_02455 [Pirellulaceae bacterium]|nr:hypothetical protein [Pirellulaceae bacterium]
MSLPSYLLFMRPDESVVEVTSVVDGFQIQIRLTLETSVITRDGIYKRGASRATISLTRPESLAPPPPIPSERSAHVQYFDDRRSEFTKAAVKVMNRLIYFFKYQLHNPGLRDVNVSQDFGQPKWTDEHGNSVGHGSIEFTMSGIPGINGEPIAAELLSYTRDAELVAALATDTSVDLASQILSDAQAALCEGHMRRAILEMAVACETATKELFFPPNTATHGLLEMLSNPPAVKDLIDKGCLNGLGESFKVKYPTHHENIDYLFRCRNKAVHLGQLWFIDNHKNRVEPTTQTLSQWFVSCVTLLDWLHTL